ncbi:MAG: hypothetical protein QGF18_04540 [Alphaproteobacteria bacterium]|nr:hypothetical protein [Alphaproteobacteria bacterium]
MSSLARSCIIPARKCVGGFFISGVIVFNDERIRAFPSIIAPHVELV